MLSDEIKKVPIDEKKLSQMKKNDYFCRKKEFKDWGIQFSGYGKGNSEDY